MSKRKPAEAKALANTHGYWDATVPDLSALLATHGVDAVLFAEWLGPKLSDYLGTASFLANLPTKSEETAQLLRFSESIDTVLQSLRPLALPPDAAEKLYTFALKQGQDWNVVKDRARKELIFLSIAVKSVARDFGIVSSKRGRKSAAPRDKLLAEVAGKLRLFKCKATVAQGLAQDVLKACGVANVGAADSVKKAVRRGKK